MSCSYHFLEAFLHTNEAQNVNYTCPMLESRDRVCKLQHTAGTSEYQVLHFQNGVKTAPTKSHDEN